MYARQRLAARASYHPAVLSLSLVLISPGRNITEEHAKIASSPSVAATLVALGHEQQTAMMYNGRPDCLHGPPLPVNHESFGIFLDVMTDDNPMLSAKDYMNAVRFMQVAATTYENKSFR